MIKILESDIEKMVRKSVLMLLENAETNNINAEKQYLRANEHEVENLTKEDVIRMFGMKEETTLKAAGSYTIKVFSWKLNLSMILKTVSSKRPTSVKAV